MVHDPALLGIFPYLDDLLGGSEEAEGSGA